MFDNTCKYLAENFSSDFAAWLLGQPTPLTTLEPTELSVAPIRVDAVILLQSGDRISNFGPLILEQSVIQQVFKKEIMQESVIYQDILAEGLAEGRAQGRAEGELPLILRQLTHQIGAVPATTPSFVRSHSAN